MIDDEDDWFRAGFSSNYFLFYSTINLKLFDVQKSFDEVGILYLSQRNNMVGGDRCEDVISANVRVK
jgi:hypothetical protein